MSSLHLLFEVISMNAHTVVKPKSERRGWAAPHLPWSLQRPLARIYLLVGLLGLCLASWTAALPHIPFPPILRTPAVCGSPAQGHFLPHSFPPPAPLGE